MDTDGWRVSMADTRICASNGLLQSPKNGDSQAARPGLAGTKLSSSPPLESPGQYIAVSPKGVCIPIPKELFVALSDFVKTRKCPGSITIQFRSGEILCVESVAKKTYRSNL